MTREGFSALLGTLASFFAASCCVGPTLFVLFGTSLGGLGFLSFLEPYRPYFLLAGYLAVGYSLYSLYLKRVVKENLLKKPAVECACEESITNRISKGITWLALLLLIVATFYPYVLEKVYGG